MYCQATQGREICLGTGCKTQNKATFVSSPLLNILLGQRKGTKQVWNMPWLETARKSAVRFGHHILVSAGKIIQDPSLCQCLVRMCSSLKASVNIKPVRVNSQKLYLMLQCLKTIGALKERTNDWTQPYFTQCPVDCVKSNLIASMHKLICVAAKQVQNPARGSHVEKKTPEIHWQEICEKLWKSRLRQRLF